MANCNCCSEFTGTQEQETKLRQMILEYKDVEGALMPVLQKAQDIYGYLPKEVQVIIAKEFGIPLEEVYGVVTFYSQFYITPRSEHQVSVCLGTACYVKGAQEVFDRISQTLKIKAGEMTDDGKFSLDACRCVGACGLAPVMMVGDDVFGKVTADEVAQILAKYH
ncbi:MAG: NADH-quinone oxidoreductase subunit NuoE [Clostridia bacterium]